MMVKKVYYDPQRVAQTLGISKQTLFRYEKKGIFPKARRNSINNWRRYTKEDMDKLSEIMRKNIG